MHIDELQALCLKLPAVTQDVKWGNDLVFSVGGKMFCVVALEPPFKCSFKVGNDEFEELSNRDGFVPAPYLARAKWVLVENPIKLHQQEWQHYIHQSYELVKAKLTKKEKQQLGI